MLPYEDSECNGENTDRRINVREGGIMRLGLSLAYPVCSMGSLGNSNDRDMNMRETRQGGFAALLVTMSCGAVNDNLLKGALLISVAAGGMWGGGLGGGGTGWVTVMLYLPFILLLGVTGQLADRYPKRRIIVLSRVAEIALAVGVTLGLWFNSLWIVVSFFVLLATQSAFFSPAKYGSVPELVSDRELSRANGLLSMLTNLSIVLGVALSGAILQIGPVVLGLVMIGIAIAGLIAAIRIPLRDSAAPHLSISARTFSSHLVVMREMRKTPLITAAFAWSWFYAVGSLVLMIVPEWRDALELDDFAASAMLAMIGIGLGFGGLVAGFASGHRIIAGFIPVGAIGMTLTFVLLGLLPPTYVMAVTLLGLCGVFAGFYVIPILAMLQHLPVPGLRARVLGTSNFLTYVVMSASAVLYALIAPITTNDPSSWFLVCAVGMGLVSVASLLQHPIMRRGADAKAFATVGDST